MHTRLKTGQNQHATILRLPAGGINIAPGLRLSELMEGVTPVHLYRFLGRSHGRSCHFLAGANSSTKVSASTSPYGWLLIEVVTALCPT
jgi:hypothetical protein